jgi:hypothetical protein
MRITRSQLRKSIRGILLEARREIDKRYDIAELICSGDVEKINIGIELGITLGYIDEDSYKEGPGVKFEGETKGLVPLNLFQIAFPDKDPEAATFFIFNVNEPLYKAIYFHQPGPDKALEHYFELSKPGFSGRYKDQFQKNYQVQILGV